MDYHYDVAVVGGGPAGISAAINIILRGKTTAIFSNSYMESALYKAKRVDNYPGLPGISGAEMLERMNEHALEIGIRTVRSQVLSIAGFGEGFMLSVGSDVVSVKSVILATGVVQTAFYEGESEFLGRGVSYCATCDGMLYRGRKVAVIGLRSDAVEEANQLKEIGCDVVLITPDGTAEDVKPGIDVMKGKTFVFQGEERLQQLIVDNSPLSVDCVFIVRPSVAPGLLMPELTISDGHITVSDKMETNIDGVFAAGDCTGRPYQINKAAGQGQIAAFSATSYLDQ
jgi:thioredoxin reductase (NADPH)